MWVWCDRRWPGEFWACVVPSPVSPKCILYASHTLFTGAKILNRWYRRGRLQLRRLCTRRSLGWTGCPSSWSDCCSTHQRCQLGLKVAGALRACPADPTEDDSAQTLVRMPLKMGYNAHSSGHREGGTIIAWSLVVLPQTLTQKMEIKLMGKKPKTSL